MHEKEIKFRKIRDTGEIISDTFQFLKLEYQTIFKLISGYVLPFIVLNALLQVHVQRNILSKIDIYDTEAIMANFGPVYLNFFLATLFALFVQSLLIGAFYTYLEAYIKEGKSNFELSDITPRLFSNSLQALMANIVLFALFMLGVILCILPGIYLANTFSILVFTVLFEKNNLTQSMQRTLRLVHVQWWNTLLINITGIALIYFAGILLSLPTVLFENGSPDTIPGSETVQAGFSVSYWVWIGITSVITSLLWLVPYTFLALQYFNLDERSKSAFPPVRNF